MAKLDIKSFGITFFHVATENNLSKVKIVSRATRHAWSAYLVLVIVHLTLPGSIFSQKDPWAADRAFIQKIFSHSLSEGRSYPWLRDLCYTAGHRLSGSLGAEKAVQWTKAVLDTCRLDSVWLQPVMVPRWERGAPEKVEVLGTAKRKSIPLPALALGGSVGTGGKPVVGEVVEVRSWEALDSLGRQGIAGKIVFYNRPMECRHINTFEAYGGAVDQRVSGPSRAAKYGAVAVLVRSMGLALDDYPHTGMLRYDSAYALIPAAAISTNAAERLSALLREEPNARVSIALNCRTLPDVLSYNVIGEIRGSLMPDKIILVGGHLDSWDVGHGAHDDGAGCVQSMEVLYLLRQLGYRPRHTLRCVLFMNEENGLRGGLTYAAAAEEKEEMHLFALESDAGGFTPRGFSFDADPEMIDSYFEQVLQFEEVLRPFGLALWRGGSGADISPLRGQKGLLAGLRPDSQRYFDFHHTAADVFEAVHPRELQLGAASMAALIYLIDKYGL
ncbi:MAG: M28 family peptidase [Saprospiraceae bacterium]|nr:M28 family peptidase [Saprospiraceae bacterium]MDW8229000.1 M28 family peptidase [Saprospiraceae bacterium]